MITRDRTTRMTSEKIPITERDRLRYGRCGIADREIRSASTPYAFSMINDSSFCHDTCALGSIMRCPLSLSLTPLGIAHFFPSLSLSLSHTLSSLLRRVSLFPSLRCLPFMSILRSTAANTLSFSLFYGGRPPAIPFIPLFLYILDMAHRLIMELVTMLQRFRRGSFYSCDRYYYVAATTSAKPVSILALR